MFAPACGSPTPTAASAAMPSDGKCASPICCATRNTRSTAVTRCSASRSRNSCCGPSSSAADDTASMTRCAHDGATISIIGWIVSWRAAPTGYADRKLHRRITRQRAALFTFVTDLEVPPTNNISERQLRPSVIFRKVTNGFRSAWGAETYAAFRSLVSTAKLKEKNILTAIQHALAANLAPVGGEQLPKNFCLFGVWFGWMGNFVNWGRKEGEHRFKGIKRIHTD